MNAPLSKFEFTDKQKEAQRLLGGSATHILLEGGSGSGKTQILLRSIIQRAINASGSRHGILRFKFAHLGASLLETLWPKTLDLCYPGLRQRLKTDRSMNWFDRFPNGSEVWWGGLDEKDRVDKMLGQEYATIYCNESSQIPWSSRTVAATRLRQEVKIDAGGNVGKMLPLRFYQDCNPPTKGHWLYKVFHQGVNPRDGKPLRRPENYVRLLMNPADNAANLPAEYLEELQDMTGNDRLRFWEGLYAEDNPHALFNQIWFDKWRADSGPLPKMQRVVVAVDPSGADENHPDADEIGIVVAGIGVDGNGYLLEDLTLHASPAGWGRVAAQAVRRHDADCVVGERNFGGAMVKYVIESTQADLGVLTRYKEVTSSRGKALRAEPFSALCEKGSVRLAGRFPKLEAELCAFSTHGYTGEHSPNRGDAAVFAFTELFPAIAMHSPASRQVDPVHDDDYVADDEDGVDLSRVA